MKSLQELIKGKGEKDFFKKNGSKLHEIYVERAFMDVCSRVIKNIEKRDFKKIYLKKNILYVRAYHSSIASEVWRNREKIKKEINNIPEAGLIDQIRVN